MRDPMAPIEDPPAPEPFFIRHRTGQRMLAVRDLKILGAGPRWQNNGRREGEDEPRHLGEHQGVCGRSPGRGSSRKSSVTPVTSFRKRKGPPWQAAPS